MSDIIRIRRRNAAVTTIASIIAKNYGVTHTKLKPAFERAVVDELERFASYVASREVNRATAPDAPRNGW
jgi:hypothetical protein